MANTVIGVYDNYSQAQQAVKDLTNAGFSIGHINLRPEQETDEARQATLRHSDQNESGIRVFFRSLFGTGGEERHADLYSEAVRRGSYLLTVHAETDDQADHATKIMNRYEPVDINERSAQWQSEGSQPVSSVAPSTETADQSSRYAGDKTAIPVIQEELHVGKRVVQRGGLRIVQHVVETPVNESVQLREEHVSIERHAVDVPASEADMSTLKERSFEVRESAEEPVVEKTARVVEEVIVGKDVSEHTETISDTVRRTDVEIEKMGSKPGAAFSDSDFRRHWQTTYGQSGGTFEDYVPAYQLGSRMANDTRYSKYRWADVEPDVQREWETHKTKYPWARVKDAVRYGWEKIAG